MARQTNKTTKFFPFIFYPMILCSFSIVTPHISGITIEYNIVIVIVFSCVLYTKYFYFHKLSIQTQNFTYTYSMARNKQTTVIKSPRTYIIFHTDFHSPLPIYIRSSWKNVLHCHTCEISAYFWTNVHHPHINFPDTRFPCKIITLFRTFPGS